MLAMYRDPSGALISFADMMKKQIVMPAHLMNDGQHTTDNGRNLFKDFSSVAQTTKTYTGQVCLPCVLNFAAAVAPVSWKAELPHQTVGTSSRVVSNVHHSSCTAVEKRSSVLQQHTCALPFS